MHFTNFFMFASFWTGRRRSIFEIGLFAVRPICCVLPSEGFKYVFEFAFCCVAGCGETETEPTGFRLYIFGGFGFNCVEFALVRLLKCMRCGEWPWLAFVWQFCGSAVPCCVIRMFCCIAAVLHRCCSFGKAMAW